MAEKKPKRRSFFTPGEILMFLAGILFCLVLISSALLGGLFARYTTTASGQDHARVAKFGDLTLTETGDFVANNGNYKGIIIPGVDLEKSVTLSFEASEVATILFLEVQAPGWSTTDHVTFQKDAYLLWSLPEDWLGTQGWQYLAQENSAHVYYKELPPNTSLEDVAVIENGTIIVSEEIKESNIQSLDNLNISFRASVIQNDGSLTPETAWNRLK